MPLSQADFEIYATVAALKVTVMALIAKSASDMHTDDTKRQAYIDEMRDATISAVRLPQALEPQDEGQRLLARMEENLRSIFDGIENFTLKTPDKIAPFSKDIA